jgi:pyrroloquinoline quinone biosynthesis protein B
VPQWNCACTNCRQARSGIIPRRTQSSVAVSDERGNWYLVNASPDLPAQLETFKYLQPKLRPCRNSPVRTVLLTNADLDHTLGLFLLREGGPLTIYASDAVRRSLCRGLGLDRVLKSFCGVVWRAAANGFFQLGPRLYCRAIPLPGRAPRYDESPSHTGHACAYQFVDRRTGRRLLIAPDVAEINGQLRQAMKESQAVLFDGTFWSGHELRAVKRGAWTAAQMGHVTIKETSLAELAALPARHKIYIHINNTNPILTPNSRERAAVEAAGIVVGYDGLSFDL